MGLFAEGAYVDTGHSCCGCALDAEVSVFIDEAEMWGGVYEVCGLEIDIGSGLWVGYIVGADEVVEEVDDFEVFEYFLC